MKIAYLGKDCPEIKGVEINCNPKPYEKFDILVLEGPGYWVLPEADHVIVVANCDSFTGEVRYIQKDRLTDAIRDVLSAKYAIRVHELGFLEQLQVWKDIYLSESPPKRGSILVRIDVPAVHEEHGMDPESFAWLYAKNMAAAVLIQKKEALRHNGLLDFQIKGPKIFTGNGGYTTFNFFI